MKQFGLIIMLLVGISSLSFGQLSKATWDAKTEQVDGNTYKITLIATVEDGWYIYSQDLEEGGPKPTEISFDQAGYTLVGTTSEEAEIEKEHYDEVFEIDIKKFGRKVEFTQVVKTKGGPPSGVATVKYMSCSESKCNPPRKVEVSF